MFSYFRKNSSKKPIQIEVDMHSHLLPGIDDGVKSLDDSIIIIKKFIELGYRKIITTPHIMADYYKNTPEIIRAGLEALQERVRIEALNIEIEAAAEYYLDEFYIELLNQNKEILTFGSKHVLFELPFMNKPIHLEEGIFLMLSKGYKPILAHPERYLYYQNNLEELRALKEKGVYFQINTNSLVGFYNSDAKKTAELLIKNEMVDFIGSDTHNDYHMNVLPKSLSCKMAHKAFQLTLLNDSL